MGTEQDLCPRDGVATRLRCAKCEAAICPACMVRTPVGFKCRECAGDTVRARRRRPAMGLAVGAGVVAVALVAVMALRRAPPSTGADPVGPQAATARTREAMLGEEAVDGQLTFVVDDFVCGPKPSGKLCRLRVSVRNTSSSPALFLGRFQYLVDGQQKTYGADDDLTRAEPDNSGRSISELTINPDVVVPLVLSARKSL